MLKGEQRRKEITARLSILAYYIKLCSKQGLTDANKEAENFFCGLLNIVFGTSLKNMNYIQRDYAAIDLGDRDEALAIQVTSTNSREKIEYTLAEFFKHEQDQIYNQLIVLIIGDKVKYRKEFKVKRRFRFDPDKDIWDTAMLCEEIMALDDEKQEEVLRYLEAKMVIPQVAPPQEEPESDTQQISAGKKLKYELPSTLGFVGREEELAELEKKLWEDNDKLFFITGLGGMGKTELAVRFGQKQRKKFKVHFARFVGSFRQTVSQSIALGVENLWLKESRPEEDIYRDVMRVLKDCGDDTILIIDNADPLDDRNFDLLKDQTYEELCALKLRLVITTRAPVPGGVKVERMSNERLQEIMRKYVAISDDDANALIKAVDGHTLTIDLMARAMTGGWKRVTPEKLLEALRRNTLSTDIGKTVTSDYSRDGNREKNQRQIHEHLRAVFNVSDIPENAKQALRCATLLPEAGMNADLFCDALPRPAQEALDALADRAWLRVENDMATIHPVIRLICYEELKPTDESCRVFLENLWGNYDKKKYDHTLYGTIAELYTTAAEKLENERGGWSGRGRALWSKVGQYDKAMVCAKMTIERREQSLPVNELDLADAYNDMGLVYNELRKHQEMMEYYGKALEIRRRVLDTNHVDLAKSYNNVGVAYSEKGDYQTALDYQLRAMEIFEKILPQDDLDLAKSYSHVGGTYSHLRDYRKALEYQVMALSIRKKILPVDHPDLSESYNNVGIAYVDLGNYGQALKYQEQALAICKNSLPSDHRYLALSYNNIGSTYFRSGNYRMAQECFEKALGIFEKSMPEDSPDIAEPWFGLGCIHGVCKNYSLAVEYLERALAIFQARLPAGHPNIKNTRDWLAHFRRKRENQRPSWMDQIK